MCRTAHRRQLSRDGGWERKLGRGSPVERKEDLPVRAFGGLFKPESLPADDVLFTALSPELPWNADLSAFWADGLFGLSGAWALVRWSRFPASWSTARGTLWACEVLRWLVTW